MVNNQQDQCFSFKIHLLKFQLAIGFDKKRRNTNPMLNSNIFLPLRRLAVGLPSKSLLIDYSSGSKIGLCPPSHLHLQCTHCDAFSL